MKTLIFKKLFLLSICLAAFVFTAYSQPSMGFRTEIYVNDPSYKTITTARIEAVQLFKNGKRKVYAKTGELEENRYTLDFDYPGPDENLQEDFLLKVTANGFKPAEGKVNFSDGRGRSFEFILAPEDSKESSKFFELQYLQIRIEDKKGYAIEGAKLTFTAKNGRKYEVTTDVGGMSSVDILAGDYDVEIEYEGLKRVLGKRKVIESTQAAFFEAKL